MILLIIIFVLIALSFVFTILTGGAILSYISQEETKEILIRYKNDTHNELVKTAKGDCIDLYIHNDYEYKAGDTVIVDFGVAMKLPEGYEAHIYPRSSLYQRTGLLLTNSVGIIDNSYQGNNDWWQAKFYATRDGKLTANERLCQFRLVENMPDVVFTEVNNLLADDRGGYGSTGK